MPGGLHAENEYHSLLQLQEMVKAPDRWNWTPTSLKERTRLLLSGREANFQFKRDTALWYGAILKPGEAWKGEMLKRLFAVLYWGGLMVKRGNAWSFYYQQRIPICSAISHTARVLIQLPDASDDFWNWLWGDTAPRSRWAAGHGIEGVQQAEISNGVFKSVGELKKDRNVSHFGVNIALGGCGNFNMISGHEIRDNGEHGHLYLAYSRQAFNGRKALLVGAEQSAPWDRSTNKVRDFFKLLGRKGVPDQYGGYHGLGGHSRYSATGGDDFAYQKSRRRGKVDIEGANLYNYGPSRENYYDGMFIDLNQYRFQDIQNKEFDASLLARSGFPCIPSGPSGPPVPPRTRRFPPKIRIPNH